MLKRNWLQALSAAVCILALVGCGDECVDKFDCKNNNSAPPAGKEYTCNDEHKCVLQDVPTPTCSPACADSEFCDTNSGSGVCRTCSETQGCNAPQFCDVTADNGKGVCKTCSDTVGGNGMDQGCSAAAPVCDTSAGNGVGVCKACVDSASGNGMDLGCSATAPVCDASAGNGAGVCKACVDSATGSGTDLGCSDTAPICNTSASNGSGMCTACADSATGNGTDLGCSDTAPICNTSASNGAGMCKACVDSATGNGTDLGCSDTAPMCDAAASNGAGMCKACVDSATGNGTDMGCSASAPLCDTTASNGAGTCKVCEDSAMGNGTDVGCAVSAPICDTSAASGAGACKLCIDSAASGNTDLGCSGPTALCDPAGNNGLGTCNVCLTSTNEGCPGSQTCNAAGTACEGCADDSSCTNPATPFCKPPPPVSICVECISDANCSTLRPVCDTTTNFCGCKADADCAPASGNTDFCDTAANNSRGECKVCVTDANCASVDPTKPYCDNQTACIQCRANADCTLAQVCDASNTCVPAPGADPATTSTQIQAFIDAPVGTLSPALTIENAFVTYIKPALGTDVAGFFLQAEPDGPAMFVAVDASTFQLEVGDRITLTVGEVQKLSGDLEAAATVSNVTINARGYPVQNLNTATPSGLAVDRSSASDLQTNLVANYESELISLTGTIASASASSGTGHVAFSITTAGMPTAAINFKLRVPATLADALDIAQNCGFTLKAGPMWRFTTGTAPNQTDNAQPSAYYASDLELRNCPAPKPVTAVSTSPTQVVLTFDRRIDPGTVLSTGEQFTFTNGLTATAASLVDRQITLTTSTQTAGADYTVTVAASVTDLLGTPVSAPNNTTTFKGYRVPAVLRITEIQPSAASSADLVELQAISGGTVEGFVLQQDVNSPVTLATLPNATVAAGDIMVVHISPAAGYTSETTAKDQFPASSTAVNYDTAWDFAGNAANITFSNRIVLVKDAVGNIQDAIPFVKTDLTSPPGAFPANLQAIQALGLWTPADCGGAPCSYTSTPTAQSVSADWTSLPSSGATKTSNTVHRVVANDTNTKDDWGVGAQSWGLPNP